MTSGSVSAWRFRQRAIAEDHKWLPTISHHNPSRGETKRRRRQLPYMDIINLADDQRG
jgi:hypothetical protein